MKNRLKLVTAGMFFALLFTPAVGSELAEDYIDMATGYVISGNYNEALKYINRILTAEPNNATAKLLKADLEQFLNPSSKSYLYNNNPPLREAFEAKKSGNNEKALSILKSAAESSSNNFWANYFLAEAYRENKSYSLAIQQYRKTLTIRPAFAQCYLGIATASYESRNYTGVISAINDYLKYYPESDFAYALRAKSYMMLAQYTNAEVDIKKALAINEDISYQLIEGIILYQKGNFVNAKKKLAAIANDIQTAEVYKYMGFCDYALKNYPEALLNIDKAIILSDDDKSLNAKYNEVRQKLQMNN